MTSIDDISEKIDRALRQQRQILDAVRDLRSTLPLQTDLQNLSIRTETGARLAQAEERLEALFERRIAELERWVADLELDQPLLPNWEDEK
jgi:hypothetical protein